jgi:hypothetical protein
MDSHARGGSGKAERFEFRSKGGGESIARIEKATRPDARTKNLEMGEECAGRHLGDDLERDLRLGVPVLVRMQLQRCMQIQNHTTSKMNCC